jgi:3-oxoadipate enol-lactonase
MGASNDDDRGVIPAVFSSILTLVPRRSRGRIVARYRFAMAKSDVVLLHGWMMEPSLWAHQEEALAEGMRPHAVIQPGHGVAVSRLPQNPTMQDWAAWFERELDGRGLNDAVLVGHDIGGLVAQEMWRRSPERVKALVFVSTLDEAWTEPEKATLEALSDVVLDWNADTAGRVSSALIGADFLSGHANWIEDWREQVARTYDLAAVRELGRLAAAHDDYRANSESIRVPTVVINGGADSMVESERARAMADRIPEARFVQIPESGHAPPLEYPQQVTDALVEFTAGL